MSDTGLPILTLFLENEPDSRAEVDDKEGKQSGL